jgi:hypothetical protein
MRQAPLVILLAVGLVSSAAAGQPAISDQGRAFAAQILGAERASRLDRLKAVSYFMTPWATWIRFYYPPTSFPGDLCQRIGHETTVSFDPVRQGRGALRDVTQLAVGPDCRSADRPFATVGDGISLTVAAESLRNARNVQAAAVTNGPLPFDLSCEDELNLGCANAGRATLASLRLDQANLIDGQGVYIAGPWDVSAWIVNVTDREGRRQVTLRRRRPAPF